MRGYAQDDCLVVRLLRDVKLEGGGVISRGSTVSLPADAAAFLVDTRAAEWLVDGADRVRVGDPVVWNRDPTLAR